MSKVYDFSESQFVIGEAWELAINHLSKTLGDQYTYSVSDNARFDFYDKVEQDIEYLKECPVCGTITGECDFVSSHFEKDILICDDCYEEESLK